MTETIWTTAEPITIADEGTRDAIRDAVCGPLKTESLSETRAIA